MKRKRIISLVVSVCMLMTFIPFQAMAGTEPMATVTLYDDVHRNEYAVMNGEEEIQSGDDVLIGTELKIIPTEVAPEGYVINGFWLYFDDDVDEHFDIIEGDSFIVTKDLRVENVEFSYVIGENEGDIWVCDDNDNNNFYIWDSVDIDESGKIDTYDFLEFNNSDEFSLEPHVLDYFHTVTSNGEAINSNIYAVVSSEIYFGDLDLGTGGVYGYSYEIEDEVGPYTYYPDINLEKGKLTTNNIYGEYYIWIDVDMDLYVKEDIVCDYIESYGGTIAVDGDITAPEVWFDSEYGPLYVTVGGNINTIWFDHEGGYVNVGNSIIADYNEELFDDLTDLIYEYGLYIDVKSEYAYENPTQLIVEGDIKVGEEGYIDIGDEEEYNGRFMLNSLNMENESEDKPRRNKDSESDDRMMLAFYDEGEVDSFVEVYAGGNIEAGREINIYNGTVIAEGSIKTTNEDSHKTIYIYGGNVQCNEMHSATGIDIYDNPMGTSVDVTGDMTAEHSICMFRNPCIYGEEYDYDTPGFIEVNVGGDIISGNDVIIGLESLDFSYGDNLDIPMFIGVNAENIKSENRISIFGGEDSKHFTTFLVKINLDGDMTATDMVELLNSDVSVGGSISTTENPEGSIELLVGIAGSIVRCGSIESAGDLFISDGINETETIVYVKENITANRDMVLFYGKIYASGVSVADEEFIIFDSATLFDAFNNNQLIIPTNNYFSELFRTKLSGLAPNATVEIVIENDLYVPAKSFVTDADKDGNIYVWLLGDDTVGTAYYGVLETLATSPTAISSDGTEIEFKPLDAKLATISMDIPDAIFNLDTGMPWGDYEDEENPFNPINWIFEYEGDTIEGFPEDLDNYNFVFARNGQSYDIDNIGGFLAGDYKVTVSIEQEIEGETYIAVGVAEFTIEPWVITIEADNKKLLKGSEIDEDFFTISYNDSIVLSEELDFEEIFGGFKVICDGNTENVGTYPIYVKPLFVNDFIRYKFMMKVMFDESMQIKLVDGTFTVYEESPEEPEEPSTRPSTTYYTITASSGEGGTISPKGSVRVARGRDKTFEIIPEEGYVIKDVLVNGVSVGNVDSYTFDNITKNATIEALFSPTEPEEWENPFDDVNENDWFYNAVEFCVKNGLFTGMTDNSFQPDTHVTRGMFVTILGRLYGINPDDYNKSVFDDVAEGEWYSPYVQWAFESEIVKGYGEKNFAPNDKITREQMCSIIVRYCKFAGLELEELIEEAKFDDDGMISLWAKEHVKKSQMSSLIQGIGNNKFNPLGNANRAEAAALLMRLIHNVIN